MRSFPPSRPPSVFDSFPPTQRPRCVHLCNLLRTTKTPGIWVEGFTAGGDDFAAVVLDGNRSVSSLFFLVRGRWGYFVET